MLGFGGRVDVKVVAANEMVSDAAQTSANCNTSLGDQDEKAWLPDSTINRSEVGIVNSNLPRVLANGAGREEASSSRLEDACS